MPKYEVVIDRTTTAWIEVEADDREAAVDEALEIARVDFDSQGETDPEFMVIEAHELTESKSQ